ncbi:hypothetical protein E2C01_096960 [Portunus trituberculatus]|uniref:Uncharacterized protein n=1 Tax=Portunus trituberculatus TaxID=210409 RepID=A0A5B7JZ67_PORTR|nr:hypothetical protein [Portunus trituberculatus]
MKMCRVYEIRRTEARFWSLQVGVSASSAGKPSLLRRASHVFGRPADPRPASPHLAASRPHSTSLPMLRVSVAGGRRTHGLGCDG